MSHSFRVALVGLGNVAEYHRAAIDALGSNMRLQIGIDPDPKQRETFSGTSAPELTESILREVDAVVVATPTQTHAELAAFAIGNGCPVLLEKPAITNLSDWTQLTETATAAGVPLHTAFHARFSADRRWYRQAERWLIGQHGPVCGLHSQAFDPYIANDVLQKRALALEGSWLDSGINVLSGIDMVVEGWMVESVRQISSGGVLDTAAVATLRFDRRGLSGAGQGVIETSWHAPKSWKQTTLSFEETGAFLYLQHSLHRAVLRTPDKEQAILFEAPKSRPRLFSHYDGVYREFIRVLMGENDNRALSSKLHEQLLHPIKAPSLEHDN